MNTANSGALTAQEKRTNDLIAELNQFYVEVTGNGISDSFEKVLREQHDDTILALLEEKKAIFYSDIYAELEEASYKYVDPFEVAPQY